MFTPGNGAFHFADVPNGIYRFSATMTGFPSETLRLCVQHAETVVNIQLQQEPGGCWIWSGDRPENFELTGMTIDDDGQPLRPVRVEVFDEKTLVASALTDDQGRFAVTVPAWRNTEVRFRLNGYSDMQYVTGLGVEVVKVRLHRACAAARGDDAPRTPVRP